ncbi:unnamed protein product [Pylaiella littoralis]
MLIFLAKQRRSRGDHTPACAAFDPSQTTACSVSVSMRPAVLWCIRLFGFMSSSVDHQEGVENRLKICLYNRLFCVLQSRVLFSATVNVHETDTDAIIRIYLLFEGASSYAVQSVSVSQVKPTVGRTESLRVILGNSRPCPGSGGS